jgi:predicted RNA-binding Zn-ribbon protein involved in translation (DUF1610 family)
MCLTCGRAFMLALEPGEEIIDQNCPVCGGSNIVKHDPRNFLESLFGGFSGG